MWKKIIRGGSLREHADLPFEQGSAADPARPLTLDEIETRLVQMSSDETVPVAARNWASGWLAGFADARPSPRFHSPSSY